MCSAALLGPARIEPARTNLTATFDGTLDYVFVDDDGHGYVAFAVPFAAVPLAAAKPLDVPFDAPFAKPLADPLEPSFERAWLGIPRIRRMSDTHKNVFNRVCERY